MIKKLVVGTHNPAKIDQIRGALGELKIIVTGPDQRFRLPEVDEQGPTASDNAKIKAQTYAPLLKTPVISTDNALYFDALPADQQPGLNVRRIPTAGDNFRPTDEQLLTYYTDLIENLGGKINGHWEFAVCIAVPDGRFWETVIISPRLFVSQPCSVCLPG